LGLESSDYWDDPYENNDNDWIYIDFAPKDGTAILVGDVSIIDEEYDVTKILDETPSCVVRRKVQVRQTVRAYWCVDGWVLSGTNNQPCPFKPTHWRFE